MKPLLIAVAAVVLLGCEIDAEITVDASGVLESLGFDTIPDGGVVESVEGYTRDICREACDRMGELECVAFDNLGRPGGYDLCVLEIALDYQCMIESNSCEEVTECFYGG